MYRKLEKSNKCGKDICRKATGIKKSRGRGQEIYDQILKFDAEREAELYQYIEKVQNQFTRCTAQYNKAKNNYYHLLDYLKAHKESVLFAYHFRGKYSYKHFLLDLQWHYFV